MKNLIVFCLFLISCYNLAVAQTNANIAEPENVLVVYNANSDTSFMVANYYKNVRNIPTSNIVPLTSLVSHNITVDGLTHNVSLAEGNNIIRDTVNHFYGTWYATPHAWKYFYQYLALPIKEHLINNGLTGTIKYIVLVKGVPFYIQATGDSTNTICSQSIDGLLAMLGTDNYEILLDSIYNKYRRNAQPDPNYCYSCQPQITNPYYNTDPDLNMNNRFEGGVFTMNWNGHKIKLDYLVSHLDGISYDMVTGMIDRSLQAINSDNYDWFIDADPTPCHGGSVMVNYANLAASKLSSIGFSNYFFDTTEDTVTWHNKPVMSYSSNGVHTTKPPNTGEGQTLHPDYIQTQLNFNYAAGAIFNTAESFNCWRISSVTRASAPMGQVVEFFLEGGTVGVGHANEPYTFGIVNDGIMFPSYQVGYTFIDAAYMGMQYLAWQNVVIGDPLTTIAWGKQTLTDNLAWGGTNLVTGEITVLLANSITLEDNAVVRFKHNGFITGDGFIYTATRNYTLLINDWSKSLFRSAADNHPKIIWGSYPAPSALVEGYKIYRKWGSSNYALIGQVDASTFEFIDEEAEIYIPIGEDPKAAAYYVTAIIESGSVSAESSPSNIIDYWINKAGKIQIATNEVAISYALSQNYPNPFNPVTQIKYSIKEAGLVQIKVYDVLGAEVAILVNEVKEAGYHSIEFNATAGTSQLPSGVYIYKITTPGFTQAKKMVLAK